MFTSVSAALIITSELAHFHGIDKHPLLNNLHLRTESAYRMLERMTRYWRIYRPES